MANRPNIVIVDDEPQIRRILRITLEADGYNVIEAESGRDALVQIAGHRPQFVILDLGLPDFDGTLVLKDLRAWSDVPVIILSVRSAEEDIVKALDLGADDYMTKPFSPTELRARIRATQRRIQQAEGGEILSCGKLSVDLSKRNVFKGKTEVKLTNTEYLLIALLFRNMGKVLTHNYILKTIWGPSHVEDAQYLRVFIAQLRKKIEENPSSPKIIVTESGVGYRMKGDS